MATQGIQGSAEQKVIGNILGARYLLARSQGLSAREAFELVFPHVSFDAFVSDLYQSLRSAS
jgi:hypothetical protein